MSHAGIGARLAPHIFAQKYEDERRRAHDADMERIMSTGMGPHDPGNAEQQACANHCCSCNAKLRLMSIRAAAHAPSTDITLDTRKQESAEPQRAR